MMELLDLPPELFKRIIHFAIADIDARAAFKLRRVHRTFASEIFEDIITNTPRAALPARLFDAHGGAILYSRLSKSSDHFLVFIKPLIDALIRRKGTVSKEQEKWYTRAICQSMMGCRSPRSILGDLPNTIWDVFCNHITDRQRCLVAAAAIDDVELIISLDFSAEEVFNVNPAYKYTDHPTAFGAAIATDSFKVLEWLLESHWARDSRYSRHLVVFLSLAAQLAKNKAGNMIASSIASWHSIGLSEDWTESAVQTAVFVGNGSFLLDLLRFRADIPPKKPRRSGLLNGPSILSYEVGGIFDGGSPRTLKYLIEVGAVSTSKLGQYLLLDDAMRYHRYDILCMLLNIGVDINARNEERRTVLYKEAQLGHLVHVMLLIHCGANPAGISEHLCQMALRHADGRKLESDAWHTLWEASDDECVLKHRPAYRLARTQMDFV